MIALRVSIGLLCSTLLLPSFVISTNLNVYDAYHDFLHDMNGLVLGADRDPNFKTIKAFVAKLTLKSAAFVLSSFEVHNTLGTPSAQWDKLGYIENTQQTLNKYVRRMSRAFLFEEKDNVTWPPLASYEGAFKEKNGRKAMKKNCTEYLGNSSYSFQNFQWKDHHTYRLMHLDASASLGRSMYALVNLVKLILNYTATMFCHLVLNVPFIPNFMGIIANLVLFMRSWYQTEMKYPSKTSFGESLLNEMGAIPPSDGVTSLARILAPRQFQKTNNLILKDPSHTELVEQVHDLYADIFKLTNESTVAVSFNGNKYKGDRWFYIQNDTFNYGAYLFQNYENKAVFVGSYKVGVDDGILKHCETRAGEKSREVHSEKPEYHFYHKAQIMTEELRDCIREEGVELKALLLVIKQGDHWEDYREEATVYQNGKRMLLRREIPTRVQFWSTYNSIVDYVAIPL